MTLRALLIAEGHEVADAAPQVVITDDVAAALEYAKTHPTLILAAAGEIRDAVAAMREGVFGYLFVPFQPGEAGLMVNRAARAGTLEAEEHEPLISLQEAEERHILDALRRCRNNKAEAARALGIGRNTLWRKLNRIRQQREHE